LDADWVILSACNTAAGNTRDDEALSGLARAFFYAGARALLVSHWAVDSAATATLISSAIGATARDSKLSRAEAFRRAMVAMIDGSDERRAHPSFWRRLCLSARVRPLIRPESSGRSFLASLSQEAWWLWLRGPGPRDYELANQLIQVPFALG